MFIEVPRSRGSIGQTWDVDEVNRTARSWQIAGSESINGTTCVRLVGVQQSADWDHPRADSTAWRRKDTVWLVPRGGYAFRIERVIERRAPARREVSQKSVTRYELESGLQYPGQMGSDRQREITLARTLAETLTPLLPNAGKVGPKPFEAVLSRLTYHYDHVPPTPYRAVLQQLQARAEAGRRGESPPPIVAEDHGPVTPVVALGRPAPDFLVKDLTTTESTSLHRWLGHPILLVFYNPTAQTAEDVLHFAQSVCTAHAQHVTVLGLAVTDDTARTLKQRADMHLEFPILAGNGLRLSYALDTTPKLVVIDGAGMVRCSLVGWGPETAATITDELLRWIPKDEPAGTPQR
jgi:peroxiredoxin